MLKATRFEDSHLSADWTENQLSFSARPWALVEDDRRVERLVAVSQPAAWPQLFAVPDLADAPASHLNYEMAAAARHAPAGCSFGNSLQCLLC